MVNFDLVKYLAKGKRRGFSVNLLKTKLLQSGFQENDIDEAINYLNKKTDKEFSEQEETAEKKVQPTIEEKSAQPTTQLSTEQKSIRSKNFTMLVILISITGLLLAGTIIYNLIDSIPEPPADDGDEPSIEDDDSQDLPPDDNVPPPVK